LSIQNEVGLPVCLSGTRLGLSTAGWPVTALEILRFLVAAAQKQIPIIPRSSIADHTARNGGGANHKSQPMFSGQPHYTFHAFSINMSGSAGEKRTAKDAPSRDGL